MTELVVDAGPERDPEHGERPVNPSRIAKSVRIDSRVVDAWCVWLGSLATDAEAALAAAIAYQELDGPARDAWLDALVQDSSRLKVPLIAVYAPLLAVESDPLRRRRITDALGPDDPAVAPRMVPRSLAGATKDGARIGVIIVPLYLDFVQVLVCAYRPTRGFEWVRHDPIVDRSRAPRVGDEVGGARVDASPIKSVVDELAITVLAHQRGGRALPEALRIFADLFVAADSGSVPPPST
ncbi:MAG TPA: hypothetical protein VGJ84_03185 [Polyangiaceae bacterium]